MRCSNRIASRIAAPLVLLAAAAPALAQQQTTDNSNDVRFGENTRNWVQLQISGDAAERPPSGFNAEIADRVWKRYSKSFENEIPESFERESFSEGQR